MFLDVLEAGIDLVRRIWNKRVHPCDKIRIIRQDRAHHHWDFLSDDERRGGEIALRQTPAHEHLGVIRREHFAVSVDSLLRLGAVVLDDKLELLAYYTALLINVSDRQLHTIDPGPVENGGVAG